MEVKRVEKVLVRMGLKKFSLLDVISYTRV